jgi:rod shape determining protein RodA
MRVMRAEPSRFTDATARSVGAVWRSYDLQLTTYAALLGVFGLVMAYTNTVEAGQSITDSGSIFSRALMWSGIAIVAFVAATAFDYRWLKTLVWPIYGINLGLLIVTLAIGDGVGGSARWVQLGPFTFQFSELAKILMITVLAVYLGNREGRLDSLTGMLFMSGASLRWLIAMAVGVIAAIPLAWTYVLRDYQKDRILSYFNQSADVQGSGWQVAQSQITVGSGGLLGTGLTNGTQTRGAFLPVQESDFVFAVLAQELGFIGALVVFLLFAALLWRILSCAWRSKDPFGTLFGAGLATMLLFQVSINVGMVIGLLPVTGIPLPFISHGGASLVSAAIGLGVMQSVNIRQQRAEW